MFAREHDTALRAVQPIRQRVEIWLHVLGRRGRHLPVGRRVDAARTDVRGEDVGGHPRQGPAPVDVDLLAERVAHPGLPVVGENAVLAEDALSDTLGQGRTEDLEPVLLADALVPPA